MWDGKATDMATGGTGHIVRLAQEAGNMDIQHT
jgi:hypothetical protein